MNYKVLIIGLVWPEPLATAAGTRMLQLVDFFKEQGCSITFASTAAKSSLSFDLQAQGVHCSPIVLNHDSFDEFLKDLNPDIVLFDRFITEEQFGWRVEEICPKALRILDTEDLHFLRSSREMALKAGSSDWIPFIQNDTTIREVASIFRCDLSLIISNFEINLLRDNFQIPNSLLFYLPFITEKLKPREIHEFPGFQDRKDFMTIGNFKHKPNVDAVRYLKSTIWPLIKKEMPDARLHVYGAYATQSIQQLHSEADGFHIQGWIQDKKEAFINARICLAPLRFGAGQKGKLLDAMLFGTPSITSSIGAEGMSNKSDWNGHIEDDPENFATKAIELYQEEELWNTAQQKGFVLINRHFNKAVYEKDLKDILQQVSRDLDQHRAANFIGKMLNHHTMKGHKFMSKWIGLKNLLDDKIINQ